MAPSQGDTSVPAEGGAPRRDKRRQAGSGRDRWRSGGSANDRGLQTGGGRRFDWTSTFAGIAALTTVARQLLTDSGRSERSAVEASYWRSRATALNREWRRKLLTIEDERAPEEFRGLVDDIDTITEYAPLMDGIEHTPVK